VIPRSKEKPSFQKIDKTFDVIKYLFTFFHYIELENIQFNNNELKVIFADNTLYVTSDDYEIAGNIYREHHNFIADISLLYLKKSQSYITGKLVYDMHTDILDASGNFNAYHITGAFKAQKEKDTITFNLSTNRFKDLKTLIHSFDLNKNIEAWIVDKIEAKSYTLSYLKGKVLLENEDINIDYKSLQGDLKLNNVNIFYQDKLAPVVAKNVSIVFKDESLYFDLDTPRYLDRNLSGSKIIISQLIGGKTYLNLDLNISSPLDNEVQKILKSYNLDIPVRHKNTHTQAHIKIDIPLGNIDTKKIMTYVDVHVAKGLLKYKNIELPIQKAHAVYDSTKDKDVVLDILLHPGKVKIAKALFPVRGGKVEYKNKNITLKNVHVKDDWYEGKVEGNIDTTKGKANLKFNAKKIIIGQKEKIIVLKNKHLPLRIKYKKRLNIEIPTLGLSIRNNKNGLLIKAKKIKKLKPFLRNIPLNIDGGNIDILSLGKGKYTFNGLLDRKSCFLYTNNKSCHTSIPIKGKIDKKSFHLYAFDKRVHFNASKGRIDINHINIDLEKFLAEKKQSKKKKVKKLVIVGKKSNIRYKNHVLVTDSYDIEVHKNGSVKAYASTDGDIVKFSIQGEKVALKALRMKDRALHPLIHFKGLKNGRYSLNISGNPNKTMHGEIIIEGGVMKNFKTYNNTLAFINALPALATFNSPGFSEKGFKIEEGVVEYRKIGDRIIFDSIYIKGVSATIAGKGEVNIQNKTIHMDLAIKTARELGKVVGSLPLLGYILLGKDKSVTIGLKLSGTLEKPIVKTSAAQDILTLPLRLIKRTLESPGHIINQ